MERSRPSWGRDYRITPPAEVTSPFANNMSPIIPPRQQQQQQQQQRQQQQQLYERTSATTGTSRVMFGYEGKAAADGRQLHYRCPPQMLRRPRHPQQQTPLHLQPQKKRRQPFPYQRRRSSRGPRSATSGNSTCTRGPSSGSTGRSCGSCSSATPPVTSATSPRYPATW